MITFKIFLILAFTLNPEVKKKQNDKVKVNEKLENGNKKRQKNKKGNSDHIDVPPENPKYMFQMDKVVGVAHIEYELIPDKIKYQIDIKCWGPIAKVSME